MESVPLPTCTSDGSGTVSSKISLPSQSSPSTMGLLKPTENDAKPKSTKKEKFKELFDVDLDSIGHDGVRRMVPIRASVSPVPVSSKVISKQEKPAAAPESNVGLVIREGSARLPKKATESKNYLQPKTDKNNLFPPLPPLPSTAAERRKLLAQLTKEKEKHTARVMELLAKEMESE